MKLQEIKLENVSHIYKGKDDCCRCGCGGKYIATTFMKNPRSEVNNEKAQKWLNNAKNYDAKNYVAEYRDNHINIPTGNNKCYTIYLDELKRNK